MAHTTLDVHTCVACKICKLLLVEWCRQTPRLSSLPLLHLADNLAGLAERLNHLLALLPSSNRKVAFLEQIVHIVSPVHVFEELTLHLVLGKPINS